MPIDRWSCVYLYTRYVTISNQTTSFHVWYYHDDVIKWKHFPRYWPFVRGIHRSPVDTLNKGQCLKKRLSKQSWGWSFETPSHPIWRHCNVHTRYVTISNQTSFHVWYIFTISNKGGIYGVPEGTSLHKFFIALHKFWLVWKKYYVIMYT